MSTSDIRNKVIDQLMGIEDNGFLKVLSELIEHAQVSKSTVPISEEQKVMLMMSDEDIQEGRTIDQFTLNDSEMEWLKRK